MGSAFFLAPFVFTKICRPIVQFFGMINLPTFNYMDDWLWSIRGSQMSTMAPLVDKLFSVLGWVFSDKDQQGKQVKMLGTIIDAKRRKFFAPEKKVHKALGMIAALKLSPHGVVARKDVERTTGTVMSMNLSIPTYEYGPGLCTDIPMARVYTSTSRKSR